MSQLPLKGIVCPRCQARKWKVLFTRHRMTQTIRVKRCRVCDHRIRVRETIESMHDIGRPNATGTPRPKGQLLDSRE